MLSEDRTIVKHLRTTGTTAPTSGILSDGEIAIAMDNNNPKIFFKKNNGEISVFRDEGYISNALEDNELTMMTFLSNNLRNVNTLLSAQTNEINSIILENEAVLMEAYSELDERVTALENQNQ